MIGEWYDCPACGGMPGRYECEQCGGRGEICDDRDEQPEYEEII